MATPEKAILDQVYFYTPRDPEPYLRELRLPGLSSLELDTLRAYARRMSSSPAGKMARAVETLLCLREEEIQTWGGVPDDVNPPPSQARWEPLGD